MRRPALIEPAPLQDIFATDVGIQIIGNMVHLYLATERPAYLGTETPQTERVVLARAVIPLPQFLAAHNRNRAQLESMTKLRVV